MIESLFLGLVSSFELESKVGCITVLGLKLSSFWQVALSSSGLSRLIELSKKCIGSGKVLCDFP